MANSDTIAPKIILPETSRVTFQQCSSSSSSEDGIHLRVPAYHCIEDLEEDDCKKVTFDNEMDDKPRTSGGFGDFFGIGNGDHHPSFASRGSIAAMMNTSKTFTKRASRVILEVPAAQLKRINKTEGVSSARRETQHFCDNTTLHGPKRIFHGKRGSKAFWIAISLFSVGFFMFQVVMLVEMYLSSPTVSQVSFIVDENGLDFPQVTLCNFNPVKKSYIKTINKTGDFSEDLLDYLIQTNEDVQSLYGNADRAELHIGDADLKAYVQRHPDFKIEEFFLNAGFNCSESMKMCSFGGRQFDCCKYMVEILSGLGKCYTLQMQGSDREWMKQQEAAGVNSGLQLVLDAHLEEQFDGSQDDAEPIYANAFENGFRYYIHAPETIPYLASEGVSVSPSTMAYSAITTNKFSLLPAENWGNCSRTWPSSYKTGLPYSSANCISLCRARAFNDSCGCSPFTYNIDDSYTVCTPLQTIQCIDSYFRVSDKAAGNEQYRMPTCSECKIECDSIVYRAYNSYGHGFSNGALKWLSKKNSNWSIPHIKSNFLTINVFFREMGHTEYTQVQGTSLTETLSDIGGNMGMFLGMSIITILEISLYLSKLSWIMISKKRREYMYTKKQKEKEHEKKLEEAVDSLRFFRTRKEGDGSFRHTRAKIQELRRKISHSFSSKTNKVGPMEKDTMGSHDSIEKREREMGERRERFFNNDALYDHGEDRQESVVQIEVDAEQLKRKLTGDPTPLEVRRIGRRRATTVPAVSENILYLWEPPAKRRSNSNNKT